MTDTSTETSTGVPRAADGTWTTRGRPHGSTSLTPFIVVDGAAAAIEFYTAAFGARLVSRLDAPPDEQSGAVVVMHAELAFTDGRLQLSDPQPAFGLVAPDPSAGTTQSIALYVEDCDAVVAAARAAGAEVVEEPVTFASGDRCGVVVDPFGRRWPVLTRVEDLAPEESERRVRAAFGLA